MPDVILHHFDLSPYAEKVRTMLGIKRLEWHSVQIPMVMPKPDLTALTGGYRKTPVMQIGADIYCDSNRIARELEHRFPEPTLFPDGGRGLGLALGVWGDRLFEPGAALAMTVNAELPADLLKDRREFFSHMDFPRLAERIPQMYAQLRAHLALVDEQLSDGRAFLLGNEPGLADATAWYPIWMGHGFLTTFGELVAPLAHLPRWQERMRSIGHGRRTEIDAARALAVAREGIPLPGRGVDPADPLKLRAGQRVTVTPDDYGKVPVTGDLVTLDLHEVALQRKDERAGEVVVHFPRLGYTVEAA